MRIAFIVFILLLLATLAQGKTLRVAVIDSGYAGDTAHLCPRGNFDFTTGKAQVGADTIGHGTTVVHAINTYAKGADYCILVYKVFGAKPFAPATAQAILYATAQNADIINLSMEGPGPVTNEARALFFFLSKGKKVFAAAGNGNKNLDVKCDVYPACYRLKGMRVVGSKPLAERPTGNTGAVVYQKEEFCFEGLCGTSLSTAIATGKYVQTKGKKP